MFTSLIALTIIFINFKTYGQGVRLSGMIDMMPNENVTNTVNDLRMGVLSRKLYVRGVSKAYIAHRLEIERTSVRRLLSQA